MRGWQHPGWLNCGLLPLSLLYNAAMRSRRWGYARGLFSSSGATAPVIVIGNLSVGGTGKSPLVMALVSELKRHGWRPGIISRGYGGNVGEQSRLVSDEDSADRVGDEPLMMHQEGIAPVAVGRDRVASARLLESMMGCDVIVSDDGFQHLKLRRDIDVVVVDGALGFGNGWCLPSGPLRESSAALQVASAIVVNGEIDEALGAQLERYPVDHFRMQVQPAALYRLGARDDTRSLDTVAGQAVLAVAGLGNPARFFAALERAGALVSRRAFPDHHRFAVADLSEVDDAQLVVMTEKDAVKCLPLLVRGEIDTRLAERLWVLPVAAVPDPNFFELIHVQLAALRSAQ